MKWKYVVGILISIIFVWLAFRNVPVVEFWTRITEANYLFVILATIPGLITYFIRAYRWKYLLILQKNIPLFSVFSAMSIGFFANAVLPARAGEVIRAYVLGRNENISKTAILATVLIERLLDVLSLLMIAVGVILFLPIPENEYYTYIITFGLGLFVIEMGIFGVIVMLLWKREATLRFFNKILGFFPEKIQDQGLKILDSFISGLEIIKEAKHYLLLFVTSFTIWGLVFLSYYLLFFAFDTGLEVGVFPVAALLGMVIGSFAVTIPSGPGFVGTFHIAVQNGLMVFGTTAGAGLAYATLLHLIGMVPITIIGLLFFLKENVKYAVIESSSQESGENEQNNPARQ